MGCVHDLLWYTYFNVCFSKFNSELAAIASLQQTCTFPYPVFLSHVIVTYTSCPLDGRVPTKQPFPVHFPIDFWGWIMENIYEQKDHDNRIIYGGFTYKIQMLQYCAGQTIEIFGVRRGKCERGWCALDAVQSRSLCVEVRLAHISRCLVTQ